MKKTILILLAFCTQWSLFAQSGPPNASFENWTYVVTHNPTGYTGSNDLYYMMVELVDALGGSIFIDSSVTLAEGQEGKYAVKVSNVMQVNLDDPSENEILSGFIVNTAGGPSFEMDGVGTPYTSLPTHMKGYYKFNQGASGVAKDTAIIGAWLTRWNPTTEEPDTIAFSVLEIIETQTDFTEFNIPFQYETVNSPDTLYFAIFSSMNEEIQSEDTYIIVDNISFENTVTSAARPVYSAEGAPQVFPNPTAESSSIRNIPLNAVKLTVSNSQGIQLWSSRVENTAEAVIPSQNFENGVYLITYWDKEEQSLLTQKLVVNK